MCLVNCAKKMDIIQPAMMADAEIKCELSLEKTEQSLSALRKTTRRSSIKPDFITNVTQWSRRSFQQMQEQWNKMQNSTFIR